MANQDDLRVVRTRQMIREAFFELMDTVGFSKITVENLAKKAFISRNTFYLHYTDKFDLLDQLENELLDGYKNLIMSLPTELLMTASSKEDNLYSVVLQGFEYIKANEHFFSLLIGKNGDSAFFHKLHETIKNVMMSKDLESKLKVPERYAIAIAIGGHTGLINEWLGSGMKETPAELATIIAGIFRDIPHNLIETRD